MRHVDLKSGTAKAVRRGNFAKRCDKPQRMWYNVPIEYIGGFAERQYPQLEIDLSLLQSNARAVISRCNAAGICVCGVIKGADGLPEIARTLHAAGAAELGTSRLEQVAKCRAAGVTGSVP